jgi:hypothetical protein
MGVSGQRHASATLYPWKGPPPPSTHWIGGWVGVRAALTQRLEKKILCLCRGSNPGRLVYGPEVPKLWGGTPGGGEFFL